MTFSALRRRIALDLKEVDGTLKATANISSQHESRREAELTLLSFSPGEDSEKRLKTRSTQLS